MIAARYILAGLVSVSAFGAQSAFAQCSGTTSCGTTNTASVTVGPLINLGMSSTTTTLTAPTAASLGSYVANAGPTFTVSANQDWKLYVATSNATEWDYTGTKMGAKAISDLTWSDAVGGTFAAITGSPVQVAENANASDATAVSVFFRTLYSANYADAGNRPGAYSLPLVFTLSAP